MLKENNSSIYTSAKRKGIEDLNYSTEHKKSHRPSIDKSSVSFKKNKANIVFTIANHNSRMQKLEPAKKPTKDDNFGLDNKYLESSIDREESNINNKDDQYWGQEKQEEFENLTNGSMTSLGSVPDEYTVFEKQSDKTYQKEIKVEVKSVQQKQVVESEKAKTPQAATFDENDDFETEIGDENTQSTGIDVKYSLKVPSMISHLKRKDNYLDSLDSFLNENLKAITDLIKIKKQIQDDTKSLQSETAKTKDELKQAEVRTGKIETDIARTLEENY